MATSPTRNAPQAIRQETRKLEEQIRQRAYELYEARGREDGHELDDWLRAKEEITRKSSTAQYA